MRLEGPFLGSEAVAGGIVRKHELRTRYRVLHPNVYVARDATLTFRQRAAAAWLWSRREAVVSGLSAARLHGAKWVEDSLPIELVWRNARSPKGVLTSAVQLGAEEVCPVSSLPVTSLARTAFDVGRQGALGQAVARLDALGNATRLNMDDVTALAGRYPNSRGLRNLRHALVLYDPGAQSPRETWLRLLIVNAGFPRPRTQIPVLRYLLDMGWEDIKLAAEYDGDHHRTDRAQFARDITRLEELADLGWTVVRVAADTKPDDVVRRLRSAWEARAASSLR